MATFNLGSAGNVQDLKQVKSYLYKLEEQLKYMFANLDPEENFDSRAKLIYAANAERQAALEVALEGITASYVTKETLSQLALTEDQASLRFVNKDGVVSAINASSETVSIQANKISLEGTVTANQYFKIKQDGSMEAVSGKFSGELTIGGQNQGILKIKNSSNADVGQWDATSLRIGPRTGGGYNFVVNSAGEIAAKSGEFGGTVRGGTIAVGGADAQHPLFKVDSTGNMYIGGYDTNAPFYVTAQGNLVAKSATLTSKNSTSTNFVRLRNGDIEAGTGSTVRTTISMVGTLTDARTQEQFDTAAILGEATLFAGSVWTTTNPGAQTDQIFRGSTFEESTFVIDFDFTGGEYASANWDLRGLKFVNGLLVMVKDAHGSQIA